MNHVQFKEKLKVLYDKTYALADANGKSTAFDQGLHTLLSEMRLHLSDMVLNENPVRLTRPYECTCYKRNLRNGTASFHCDACGRYGFIREEDTSMMTTRQAIQKINELPRDWDGLGAERPSHSTVQTALTLADSLGTVECTVHAGSDGSITLERIRHGRVESITILVSEIPSNAG